MIVKTNLVKRDTMLSLFADISDQQDAISRFILENGGIPRRMKLAQLLRKYRHADPSEEMLSEYLRRYATALEHQLAAAHMVEGVAEFIASDLVSQHVCSSAPESEVRKQLACRGLEAHFAAIYGGEMPKAEALRTIKAAHMNGPIVFFGDSSADYEAAREAGAAFVAVVCEHDNFQSESVVRITDFSHRAGVEQAILQSLAQRRAT
ncbi:HAD hydrolase-like protein (plasmid) [Ideonella dechloratans]|uniref:HAD family hydrolase n=1 Tax=Ideonella dechloratans TaxID=36863 RepID=UPI0014790B10|nr:HAD hydrolase-like protein [Ideonella dechloratans]UFU11957.1 HAD hydrolase-like protein [Ideonella dechloratans]